MSDTRRRRIAWAAMLVALVALGAASLWVGEGDLSDPQLGDTFLRLRVWRLATLMLAGGALAVGGVLVQGLFRNPLASPSILGTSAGASLGGVVVLLLWNTALAGVLPRWLPPELALPVGCMLGATGALLLLLAVTGRQPGLVTVLLTGFILSSFFLSLGGLLTSVAQETWELGRAVVAFTLGGVDAKGPRHIALAIPLVLAGALAGLGWGRHLDLLLAGEEEAAALGVDVRRVRRWVIAWTAALTAAAVAVGGNVSFVGLVVPHSLRPWVGVQHRRLLPAALVGGAVFLALADLVTRLVPSRSPIPLGVVTGLIGAPVFLSLLARAAREGRLT
ncbi:MAG: iron ABC transporter permease [Alphaproteobacteria bacterium]|nr:iron ABC transporter permease [Alphaproteobacteria bacterium]